MEFETLEIHPYWNVNTPNLLLPAPRVCRLEIHPYWNVNSLVSTCTPGCAVVLEIHPYWNVNTPILFVKLSDSVG